MVSFRLAAALFVASFSLPALAQVGSVRNVVILKPGSGGFVGPLTQDNSFGTALATVGDLDGNGVVDLAVGAPYDSDGGAFRGAVWILRLGADGHVLGEQKISQTQGGFGGALVDGDELGHVLAAPGDLDGDGVGDLAALTEEPNRLWILFLNPDGTVKGQRETLFTDPVFVPATQASHFTSADLIAVGDLNGDGLGDLAVGAPRDPDGATGAGAVWILHLAADGSVASTVKISQLAGGFTGVLPEGSGFGRSLVQFGDLNGDGRRELGVVSPGAQFGGLMWILSLDASEQVSSHLVRDWDDYGLTWARPDSSTTTGIYHAHEWLGDLDGDGQGELAMGFPGAGWPGTPSDAGILIARVRADGAVTKSTRIGDDRGGLGNLPRDDYFGGALAALGDLNGDGLPELAVGAPYERASGLRTGAVWILSLATSAVRNGSGVNPTILSQTADPVYGQPWSATLDCSGHAPGLAAVFAFSQPRAGIFAPSGELLVGGSFLFLLQAPHASGPALLTGAVPPFSVSLLDIPFFIQGYCTGAPGARLSNALDVIIGR